MPIVRRLFLISAISAAAAVSAGLAGCGRKRETLAALPAGTPVLALGDSITFGTGATPADSYPTLLAQRTGWNVVNAGIPGDTSAGALDRLPALLAEHKPALVIVSIGGNDFLRGMPEAGTRANVLAIVEQVKAAGAQVLVLAIPRFSMLSGAMGSLSDHPMYAEIATAQKAQLHANGWSSVLSDKSLRADPIHPNAPGYAKFTDGLMKTIETVGWKK